MHLLYQMGSLNAVLCTVPDTCPVFSSIGGYLLFTVENLDFVSYTFECLLILSLVQLKTGFLA